MVFRLYAQSICYFAMVSLLYLPNANAQKKANTKVLVNANFMERDNEKDITILRDEVQVILEQNYISCNEAIVLWSKNEIIAVGDVLLRTPNADIEADKIIYNFKEDKGKIYNGVILSGQMLIQSEYIDKVGANTYNANDAYFTSCTTCPSSWSFTADNVEATIEGYAYIKNSWLHFLEFPTIYLPYLIVPLKNNRQTGVLPPSSGVNSRSGAYLSLPFFWAINRSQDLTIAPVIYSKSGLQMLGNYRYMLSEKSSGEFNTAFLKEQLNQSNDNAYYKNNRWHMLYTHYLELPDNYIQRTNLALVSDLDYSNHFLRYFNYAGQLALDNRASLTKNFDDFHLSIDSSYYVSLIESDINRSKESSVHRLPEIHFSITDKKLSDKIPLFMRFDAQYVNFARNGLGYDFVQDSSETNPANFVYVPWPQPSTLQNHLLIQLGCLILRKTKFARDNA